MKTQTTYFGLKRRPRSRRGAALMEMALVLPMLFSLSFGVAEYGYYFFVKSTMQGAATAGSRVGVTTASTNADVAGAVGNMMSAAGFNASAYSVSVTDLQGNSLDLSTCAANTPFDVVVTASWSNIGVQALPVFLGGIAPDKQVIATAAAITQNSGTSGLSSGSSMSTGTSGGAGSSGGTTGTGSGPGLGGGRGGGRDR